MNNTLTPHIATHPGELLKDELDARDIKQKIFASEISMQATMLNEIIKGKRPITADIAILIEKALDIPADYWLNFQTQYELDLARIKEKNVQKILLLENWQVIKQYVPVKFFKKQGFLKDDLDHDIKIVKNIYNIDTIDHLIESVAAYKSEVPAFFKKSEKLQVDAINLFGWSKLVMWQANNEKVNSFDSDKFSELKDELHSIFYKNSNVREETKKLLANHGIKLIFQEKFEKTPVDGYSFWSKDNPAIGLTLRHKRIDNFAFTVFHELGHIYKHLQNNKAIQFIDLDKPRSAKTIEETEADSFAQESLISKEQWNELASNYSDDNSIISFGKKHGINPAILLGRVCYEANFYAFKSKIDKTIN
ncbi:MAG: HigA family addiction module antidote protein [Bacteroidales bacterium]|nr:HigA family addiction module antidote protein [Bacteroidales bacterium]